MNPGWILVCTLCFILALADGVAAKVPDRDWPSVVVTPILDVPMRDAAITRGPDGAFYLTGTLPAADDPADYENGRVIRVWKSTNLKTWKELGPVWSLERDAPGDARAGWARYYRHITGPDGSHWAWGIQAPELHYIKGAWWICFSVNGQGTGLLKSTSGKPEGPYECHARMTARGGDASMFADDDGSVYWLTDGGHIAKLTDDMGMLAERPKLIVPERDPQFERQPRGGLGARTDMYLADHPQAVGARGAFMFKHRDRYFLAAADYNGRLGAACDDTWIAYADSIGGPWSERHLMVPHGGSITVFEGPGTTAVAGEFRGMYSIPDKKHLDGPQFYATFSGTDRLAIVRDRPALLPLEWLGAERWEVYFFKGPVLSYPRKPQHVFTERGPWAGLRPLTVDAEVRDMAIFTAPGEAGSDQPTYYLSGSVVSRPGELVMWRSNDLVEWEEMPVLWRYEDLEWLPKKLPPASELPVQQGTCQVFWGVRPHYLEGNYYLLFSIFRDARLAPENRGVCALRSKTGRIEGPYESLGKIGGQLGVDPGPLKPVFFNGLDGKLYASNTLNWKLHVAEVDLSKPGWKWDYKPVDHSGAAYATDGFGTMTTLLGRYVLKAVRWDGPVANVHGPFAESGKHYGTYDVHYVPSDGPWGPVREAPRVLTRVGAGNMFRDAKGYWWHVLFGNDWTGPWWQRSGLVPLTVEERDGELVIEPDWDCDDYQKRIMGAGKVVEPPGVLQTIREGE